MEKYEVPSGVRVGHIHLKVSNLNRALSFYQGVLGFEITQYYGQSAVFLSAGGYHHHIGLNIWESPDGPAPPMGTTGLYHVAFLYPTRRDLAKVLKQLQAKGVTLDGAADHGVSQALYLRDPDGNGVELYWDRPKSEWPLDAKGNLEMTTLSLDLADLISQA